MIKKKLTWVDAVLGLGLAMIIGGLALAVENGIWKPEEVEMVRAGQDENSTQVVNKVYIDISGAVENQGVYELREGDRVIDVLKVCGGLSAEADRQWVEQNINRARPLKDGEKIYIPKIGEILGKSEILNSKLETNSNVLNSNDLNGLVNINKATVAELDRLPGVGPAIAQKIIDYRQEKGGFVSVEEIKLVSGIGDKMFENIKDLIEI